MQKTWLKFYEKNVPHSIDYPKKTLVQFMAETVQMFPEKSAFSYFGAKMSYAELDRQISQFATALWRLGVKKGDRVAIMLPNIPQYVVAHFATLKLGAIIVPTNPLYVQRELKHQLNDSSAETLIALNSHSLKINAVWGQTKLKNIIYTKPQAYLPVHLKILYSLKVSAKGDTRKIERGPGIHVYDELLSESFPVSLPNVSIAPSDTAIFLYTGGTTGVSKGAVLTHRNLVTNVIQISQWYGEINRGNEVVMCALPFFHSYGLTTCLHMGVFLASKMVLIPDPRNIKSLMTAIQTEKVTLFSGVPTLYVAINNFPEVKNYDLSSVKACLSGGAPLPIKVAKQFEAISNGRLVEGYGLSETSPVTHANPVKGKRKEGSIGIPLPDTDAKIVDPETKKKLPVGEVGELAVKGPQVMQGYWNMQQETEDILRDGWLFTGDIAKMDEEGYFYIVDRKKDMIIAGGFNIFPREIEEVLFEHPKVLEAAVVGMPDEYRGETVKAFIVPKENEILTQQEIIAYCKKRLAPYKTPKLVEFIDSLPKSNVGKILRRKLREIEGTS